MAGKEGGPIGPKQPDQPRPIKTLSLVGKEGQRNTKKLIRVLFGRERARPPISLVPGGIRAVVDQETWEALELSPKPPKKTPK